MWSKYSIVAAIIRSITVGGCFMTVINFDFKTIVKRISMLESKPHRK